nr:unnamed protein product [Digitaria exilis]
MPFLFFFLDTSPRDAEFASARRPRLFRRPSSGGAPPPPLPLSTAANANLLELDAPAASTAQPGVLRRPAPSATTAGRRAAGSSPLQLQATALLNSVLFFFSTTSSDSSPQIRVWKALVCLRVSSSAASAPATGGSNPGPLPGHRRPSLVRCGDPPGSCWIGFIVCW